MKVRVRAIGALIWVVALGGLVTCAAAPASALGAAVDRTDNQGDPTSTVVSVGDTNPTCCCIYDGEGEVNLGVKVCYLPL